MKKVKIIVSVLLVAVLALGVFAACGGNEAAPEAKKDVVKVIDIDLTTEEYAYGVDKDQPELLEKVNAFIEKIMSDGTFDKVCNNYFGDGEPTLVQSAVKDDTKEQLVVATNAGFEPFEYTKGDSYCGIDMEIAQLLADELGMELVIDNMDFDAVCLSVGQHKCDIAMAGLTVKEDRKEFVTFSNTYYKASQKVIAKADDTTFDACTDAASVLSILQGFDATTNVGYQNGTTGGMYVTNEADYAENALKVTGKGYKNGSLAVQDLVNGNISYVIIDSAPADCITAAINANA